MNTLTTNAVPVPLEEFEFTFARSGGPGGQNVNKVNSKAILRWAVENSTALPAPVKARFLERYGNRLTTDGELIVTGQKYRDQNRNVQDCIDRVAEMIQTVAVPPTPRRKTKPTLASKARRVESKHRQSQKKQLRRSPAGDY